MTENSENLKPTDQHVSERYLHGFSDEEQRRLLSQADFLAPQIFHTGPKPRAGDHVIELGCGVGAQTRYLCSVDPSITVTCVDHSMTQLQMAEKVLAPKVFAGQVKLVCADAAATGLEPEKFDLAYLCWVLEHAPHPQDVVREAYRLLKPKGILWVTEVFNASLQILPRMPVIEKYWQALNQLQRNMGGDPDVGLHLPSLLQSVGFTKIEAQPITFFYSKDKPQARAAMLDYWQALLLSARPSLVASLTGDDNIASEDEIMTAFDELKKNPETIFFYHPIRCVGQKPEG